MPLPGRHPSLDERFDPAIRVVDSDPTWPERAAAEADAIRQALAPIRARIEHFGSTAVPGLAGKPIIDLMVVVDDLGDPAPVIAALSGLGYLHAPNPESPRRLFFGKPHGRPREFHVHACEAASGELDRHLIVRDYLREHRDEADRYAALKRGLVAAAPEDRIAYITGKDPFVADLERRALAWAADRKRQA